MYLTWRRASSPSGLWSLLVSVTLIGAFVGVVPSPAQATAIPTWSGPISVVVPTQNSSSPTIAGSSDGLTLVSAWQQYDGSNYRVQTARSTDGGVTWSAPSSYLSASGETAYGIDMHSDTTGQKVVVAWAKNVGNDYQILVSRSLDAGATWSSPTALGTPTDDTDQVQISGSADGQRLTAVWYADPGGGYANYFIQSAYSTDAGGTWSSARNISATSDYIWQPKIVSSSDGLNVTAIWNERSVSDRIQSASSSDGGATWTSVRNVSTSGGNRPTLLGSSTGQNLIATWSQGGSPRVYSARSSNYGATWSTPVNISGNNGNTSDSKSAGSADGTKATVIWPSYEGDPARALRSTSTTDSGATWSTPVLVATNDAGGNSNQTLFSSTDGSVVTLIWQAANDSIKSVVSSDSGSTWSSPVTLTTSGATAAEPRLTGSSSGQRVTGVWRVNTTPFSIQSALTPPAGSLTFSSGAFSSATVGSATTLTVTVTNSGTSSTTPSAITPAGTGVTVTGGTCSTSASIAPSSTCTVQLAWTPAAAGSLSGASLTITYPGGVAASNALTLSGTATSGGGGGGGGGQPTPTPTPSQSSTPAPSPSATAVPSSSPSLAPSPSAVPGTVERPLDGPISIVRGTGVSNVPPIRASGPASTTYRDAPKVSARPGEVVRVQAGGLPPRSRAWVDIAIRGSWVRLGISVVNSTGRATLPAITSARPGNFPMRIRVPGQAGQYVKVAVR